VQRCSLWAKIGSVTAGQSHIIRLWLESGAALPYLESMTTLTQDSALTAGVTLAPSAAARIAAIAAKQNRPAVLRLAVEGGGCSGFQYKFEMGDEPEADDLVSETDGVRLLVDAMSLELIAGATVEYVESLGGAAFRVTNPQAASGCGCGASFSV
jgi:iron-sulfur cluster insertion protein